MLKATILGKNKNVLKLKLTDAFVIEGIYFGDIEGFEETIKCEFGEHEYSKSLMERLIVCI